MSSSLLCLATLMTVLSLEAAAQVFLTKDEALTQYFGSSEVRRKTVFLTEEQVSRIQKRARAKVESKIVTYYVGRTKDERPAYAFLETHVVRTMPETFMVLVGSDSTVRAVEILAFYEPEDYLPPRRWLESFERKKLDEDLWLKRGVQNITGATISAQTITAAVRRVLATFELAIPREDHR